MDNRWTAGFSSISSQRSGTVWNAVSPSCDSSTLRFVSPPGFDWTERTPNKAAS